MKDIKGFEGLYAVTKDGKIWSYGKRNGVGHTGKFLSPSKDRDGYYRISLAKNGIKTYKRVSRLVLETFVPNAKKLQVNHKNGIRDDNDLSNLEWVTASENIQHSFSILNKDQKDIKNNAFKPWGFILNGMVTHIKDISIDKWCANKKCATTTIHNSIKNNKRLTKGKFKGYEFFNHKKFGHTSKETE